MNDFNHLHKYYKKKKIERGKKEKKLISHSLMEIQQNIKP